MKLINTLGVTSLFAGLAIFACNNPETPGDDASGGAANTGGHASGGKSSGGAKSSGGSSSSGGRASGGAPSGGADASGGALGGYGGEIGGMGGMGGMGGGGDSAPLEDACAAACAVKTSIGCEGNTDPVACEVACVYQVATGCETEYFNLTNCEGNDQASGFVCETFSGYSYVAQSSTSQCKSFINVYQDCVTQ